jgi:hypothetical protein
MSAHQDECAMYFGGKCDCVARCVAPSPQPEMPEGFEEFWSMGVWRYVRLDGHGLSVDDMRALLATQGLTIIGAKQRAVLDACALLDLDTYLYGDEHEQRDVAEAELARRAAKDSNV